MGLCHTCIIQNCTCSCTELGVWDSLALFSEIRSFFSPWVLLSLVSLGGKMRKLWECWAFMPLCHAMTEACCPGGRSGREKKITSRGSLLQVLNPFHNPPGFVYFSESMDTWVLYFVHSFSCNQREE